MRLGLNTTDSVDGDIEEEQPLNSRSSSLKEKLIDGDEIKDCDTAYLEWFNINYFVPHDSKQSLITDALAAQDE